MRTLVTGGNGVIGKFIVDELADRGHDVTVFDIHTPDDRTDSVDYVQGDITNVDTVQEAVADVDSVVHMAAMLPPACRDNPVAANEVNVGGTLNVLDAVDGTDKRAIVASSKAVFGPITGDFAHPVYEPLSEESPKNPTLVYGITKQSCEYYCRTYAVDHGVDVGVVRFSSTYGPGKGDRHGSISLVTRLIEAAHRGESLSVAGGDQQNDFIYYSDVARGIADAVETDELNYRTYHLGSGTLSTLRDVAAVLHDLRPDSNIGIEDGLDFYDYGEHPVYCKFDISRARSDLGFEPKYGLSEGIQDHLSRLKS